MNYSMIIFYRAPNGCLQYFTGIRNTVTSFNFDGTSTRAPGGNLQIQDYTICFRTEEGKSIHNDKIMVLYEAKFFLQYSRFFTNGIHTFYV